MLKQYFISLTLLFAFSLGLAHDIIPHHHHDVVEDMEHHHHETETHAHNHSDHSEDSGHHKHDEPLGYFSHISHHITFNEFDSLSTTQNISVKVEVDKNLDTSLFITKIALFDNPLSSLEPPLGNNDSIFPRNKQFFYAHHFLRGPPAQRS